MGHLSLYCQKQRKCDSKNVTATVIFCIFVSRFAKSIYRNTGSKDVRGQRDGVHKSLMPYHLGMAGPESIRYQYESRSVRSFYHESGRDYRNPHEPQIQRSLERAVRDWPLNLARVLDLAAGSGEVTLALRKLGAGSIDAIDPFTFEAYERRAGTPAGRETFEQIADGALTGRTYTLIVCSFALHLLEPSRLPRVAYQLSRISPALLVLTPHKRPTLRPEWGWNLTHEVLVQRVRSRLYETAPGVVASATMSSPNQSVHGR
jgi:hypothetical protein